MYFFFRYIKSSQEADITLYLKEDEKLSKLIDSLDGKIHLFSRIMRYSYITIIAQERSSLFLTSQVNVVNDNDTYIQGEAERDSEIDGTIHKYVFDFIYLFYFSFR